MRLFNSFIPVLGGAFLNDAFSACACEDSVLFGIDILLIEKAMKNQLVAQTMTSLAIHALGSIAEYATFVQPHKATQIHRDFKFAEEEKRNQTITQRIHAMVVWIVSAIHWHVPRGMRHSNQPPEAHAEQVRPRLQARSLSTRQEVTQV